MDKYKSGRACACNVYARNDIKAYSSPASEARQNYMNPCGCNNGMHSGYEKPLAMAYVPWQRWGNIYSPEKALNRGTMFCDLDKPFTGRRGCR